MSCNVFIFYISTIIEFFSVMSYYQTLIIFHILNVLFTKSVHEEKNIGFENILLLTIPVNAMKTIDTTAKILSR